MIHLKMNDYYGFIMLQTPKVEVNDANIVYLLLLTKISLFGRYPTKDFCV